MKKPWDYWCDEHNIVTTDCTSNDNTNIGTISISTKAICPAKKPRDEGISIDTLRKDLANLGVALTELRQEYGEPMEITGRIMTPLLIAPTNSICTPRPKKVIFSGPATTILWKDGTKTTVKCQRHDIYDKETGIAMCYLKKLLGNKGNFNNIFREAMKVAKEKK